MLSGDRRKKYDNGSDVGVRIVFLATAAAGIVFKRVVSSDPVWNVSGRMGTGGLGKSEGLKRDD